ncbi:MAG: retropepsin-like aspartic protease [Candidatus Omnitrophota bacterium]
MIKITKIKIVYLLISIFLLEAAVFISIKQYRKGTITSKYNHKLDILKFEETKEKKKLMDRYEKEKYLATGRNAYERIYNKDNRDIVELIYNLSREALPASWNCEVKVEEFTNFILLIYLPYDSNQFKTTEGIKYALPIIKWSMPYLQNIAFFDNKHRCIFYLDENNISNLHRQGELVNKEIEQSKKRGEEFTLFNSISIPIKFINNHMFIPVTIYGDHGSHDELMMLDTGASLTMLPLKTIEETFNEGDNDKRNYEQETFSTANGLMTCFVLKRNIVVGGIDRFVRVAVNENDSSSLLGMNFFESKDYTIDTKSEYLYVWDK